MLAVSDHIPVEAEIEFAYRTGELTPTYYRNFNKIDYTVLNLELSRIILPVTDVDDADLQLHHWMNETEALLDKHAPLKALPTRKNKSINLPPEIIEMIRLRDNIVKE